MLDSTAPDGYLRCPHGHDNPPGLVFCGHCGSPLSASVPTTEQWHSSAAPIDTIAPPAPQPPRVASRSRRPLLAVVAIAAIGIVAVVAFALSASSPSGHTIRGIFSLMSTDVTGSWDACHGTGGYSDFDAGVNVSVKNAAGTTIGAGALRNLSESLLPTIVAMDRQPGPMIGLTASDDPGAVNELRSLLSGASSASCVMYYEVPVPTSDFYSITIGHRGTLDYSFADISKVGFAISSSLGD